MRIVLVASLLVACDATSTGGGSAFPDDSTADDAADDRAPDDSAVVGDVTVGMDVPATPDVATPDAPRSDVAAMPDAPTAPADPQARSMTDVCTRWRADRVLRARTVWTAGADACAPGTLSPDAHDDAMRVLNLYRWLTGDAPVAADPSLAAQQQQCAVMMTVNNTLNHMPPSTWRCYTAAGAAAAGSSNLALGTSTPAASVDLYANERDQNLGHRRWVFAPTLGNTWLGATNRASCMQVFRAATRPMLPPVAAWPNAGPSPMEAFAGVWHAQSGSFNVSGATVTVRDMGSGQSLAVTPVAATGNYGNSAAIAWRPSGWTPVAGTTYAVTLTLASGATHTYRTTPVRCP